MVTSLTLGFNEPVNFNTAKAMIARTDGSTSNVPALNFSTTDGGMTYTVTFSGGGVSSGSVADGVYQLTVAAGAVTNLAGSPLAANIGLNFLRLFGDITGDGNVNNSDLIQMRSAFSTSTGNAGFQSALDYNADGHVNNSDLIQFRSRFGESLSLPGANGASTPQTSLPNGRTRCIPRTDRWRPSPKRWPTRRLPKRSRAHSPARKPP